MTIPTIGSRQTDKGRKWLQAVNFGFRKKRNCTIRLAKTKTLIGFAIIVKLICVFVFAYSKCWISHDVAHVLNIIIACNVN